MNIPNIKNALKNIINTCEEKLSLLYPAGVPQEIRERYEQELFHLKKSKYIDDFEIFRCLSNEAKKNSTLIFSRGTITGSFIYYMLGTNCFNPLPVHYYCKKCGHYERIQTHLFGIDLPEQQCPNCKETIYADGFNLSSESVWGLDGKKLISFDYNVCNEFYPFAKRILSSFYPQNVVVPWGMFEMDTSNNTLLQPNIIGISLAGFAVLPCNSTLNDYSDLISYLDDGEPCLTGGGWELEQNQIKPIRLFSLDYLNKLIELQRATGIYANELSIHELKNVTWSNLYNSTILCQQTSMLFHEKKPKTFRDMVGLEASSHNSTIWHKEGQMHIDLFDFDNMTSSEAFKKYPCYTREDFFDYLLDTGIERSLAFETSEKIRKGQAVSSFFCDEFKKLPIPEEIKEIAQNYRYVFPRSHCIEYILTLTRIAYYAKIDSKSFSKIIFKKKP